MLCPISTTRFAPASARTASMARAKRSMENLPSGGESLPPCPGRSSVTTRYCFDSTGTCSVQVVSSQVQPCTKITVLGPLPVTEVWILRPSTVAAESESESTKPSRHGAIFTMNSSPPSQGSADSVYSFRAQNDHSQGKRKRQATVSSLMRTIAISPPEHRRTHTRAAGQVPDGASCVVPVDSVAAIASGDVNVAAVLGDGEIVQDAFCIRPTPERLCRLAECQLVEESPTGHCGNVHSAARRRNLRVAVDHTAAVDPVWRRGSVAGGNLLNVHRAAARDAPRRYVDVAILPCGSRRLADNDALPVHPAGEGLIRRVVAVRPDAPTGVFANYVDHAVGGDGDLRDRGTVEDTLIEQFPAAEAGFAP